MRNILTALYNQQVPIKYVGTWDASTGQYPVGFIGAVYNVSIGGTVQSLSSPSVPIEYAVGDFIIFTGSVWEKLGAGSSTVLASDVSYDDTITQFPTSPPVTTVQQAIEFLSQNQGGLSVTWELKTSDFNITNGGHYLVDTSLNSPAQSIVATLPPFAQLDETFYVRIKDASNNFSVTSLIVQADDQTSPYEYTIMGAQAVEVDVDNADLTLAYDTINNNIVI